MATKKKAPQRKGRPPTPRPTDAEMAAHERATQHSVKVITKSALAKLRGVKPSTVTKACMPGGLLQHAQLPTGRIDLEHPATKAWLGASGVSSVDGLDAATTVAGPQASPARPPSAKDLEALGEFTPDEFIERYGSLRGFVDHVDARKKIAETERIELQNAETAGRLIPRDLVKTHVFGAIDAVTRRLLSDTSKTIVRRAQAMFASGATVEEVQRVAVEIISATLTPMKTGAARALRERT